MGPTPLALVDIAGVFALYGIQDAELRLDYLELIQAMDDVWLRHVDAGGRMKKSGDAPSSDQRTQGGRRR